MRLTGDFSIAGFGRDFESLRNPDDEFVKQYNLILEPDAEKALFFVLNRREFHCLCFVRSG